MYEYFLADGTPILSVYPKRIAQLLADYFQTAGLKMYKKFSKSPGAVNEMVCEFTDDWSDEIAFIRSVAMQGKIEEAIALTNVILNSSARISSKSREELNNILSEDLIEELMNEDISNESKRNVLEYSLGL